MPPHNALPRLALTQGDPCGIGPEIIVKSLPALRQLPARWVVLGDPAVFEREAARLGVAANWQTVDELSAADPQAAVVLLRTGPSVSDLPTGQVDARAGRSAWQCIERAIALALDGQVAGICTAPIHKEALAAAGCPFPGHTEMLAAGCGIDDFGMMLATPELRTVLVSIHVSLRRAIESVTLERELRTIELAHRALQGFGIAQPRIAVAGLNPHAGEGGLFGYEDAQIIAPAVAQARARGLDVTGPLAGDTVFMRARRGEFDVVVAQYHDQGLIPIKLMGIEQGVNITVGLPFVRTSPDHGTAFDIAGQGRADPASLLEACRLAVQLVQAKG